MGNDPDMLKVQSRMIYSWGKAPHSCEKLLAQEISIALTPFFQRAPHPQPFASRRHGGLSRWTDDQPKRTDSDAHDGDKRGVEGGGQHGKQQRKEVITSFFH